MENNMDSEIKNNLQIIIPHIARNNELLKINIPYIQENLSPKEIVILSKKDTIDTISKEYVDYSNIVFLDEDSIYPNLTFFRIKELLSKTKYKLKTVETFVNINDYIKNKSMETVK